MNRLFVFLLIPAFAQASQYPAVVKGPVITGVTETEAWVAWSTAHHEGDASGFNQCAVDAFTGTPNGDSPSLMLSPAARGGSSFSDNACSREHRVHLTGLLPGTHYSFVLDKPFDSESGLVPHGQFTTAPLVETRPAFKFVVYGDSRNNPVLQSSTRGDHQAVVDAILANESDAAFLVHTGDLALNTPAVSGDDNGYTEFFDVERKLLSRFPLFATIGNHETIDTTNYDSLINAPGFTPNQPHPYFYSTEWGRVHFAFVDAFEGAAGALGFGDRAPGISDAQVEWLDADLAAAKAAEKALFVVTHQGPYSHPVAGSGHGGGAEAQAKVAPLILKYGVLAVFSGHDHYYQRGREGCVDYLVVGGGGAPMYDPDGTAAGVVVARKTLSFVEVSVSQSGATTAIAKDTSGRAIDSFTFTPAKSDCLTAPDAGDSDAGASDSGLSDAGGALPDGGADAGIPDGASVHDAGVSGDSPALVASGCGCRTSGVDRLVAVVLVVLWGSRGRRRRKSAIVRRSLGNIETGS